MAKVFDVSGRGPSNKRLMILGIGMIIASLVISTLLVFKSQADWRTTPASRPT